MLIKFVAILCFIVVASAAPFENEITQLKYDRYGDDRFDRYDRYDDLLDLPSPREIREVLRDIFPKTSSKVRIADAIDQLPDEVAKKLVVLVPVKVLGKNPRVSKSVLRKLIEVAVKNAKEEAENRRMVDDDDDDDIAVFLKPAVEQTKPVVVVNNYDEFDVRKYLNKHKKTHRNTVPVPTVPDVVVPDVTDVVIDDDDIFGDNFFVNDVVDTTPVRVTTVPRKVVPKTKTSKTVVTPKDNRKLFKNKKPFNVNPQRVSLSF